MANRTSSQKPTPKKFLADGMLGRLARWLRLLGYDTSFDSKADDWELLRRAYAQDRLLLTRDRQLAARRGAPVLLIESEDLATQVRQVVEAVGPPPEGAGPRCSTCNAPLMPLGREEARERVPPHVYRTQQAFQHCTQCGRVFWQGTHWQRMKDRLEDWKGLDFDGGLEYYKINDDQ